MNHPNSNNLPDDVRAQVDYRGEVEADHVVNDVGYDFEQGGQQNADLHVATLVHKTSLLDRSWPFRVFDFLSWLIGRLFGIASTIFLLAVTANIPVVQFLSFGYLLEVTGRISRGQKYKSALIGLSKASKVGGVLLATWLLLIPLRILSRMRYEAILIDPTSFQVSAMQTVQTIVLVLTLGHIIAAWICGGRIRYFLWPLIAPFSIGLWLIKKIADTPMPRRIMDVCLGWISPNLVNNIVETKPMSDWFLPAILYKKIRSGQLLNEVRDGLWNFAYSLNLPYYFFLGFKGFLGTIAWLLIPTALLMAATNAEGGVAILSGVIGTMIAIPVFAVLPFIQAHFAVDGRLRRFLEVRAVIRNMGRAPIAHTLSLLLVLALALPLFLLKIEPIPGELLWSLSIVFIVFTWPAKWIVGWAYRRGTYRDEKVRWYIRWPVLTLCAPISFAFVFILFFTRYITWNGAMSLIENHVFLLPAPFWL